MAFYCTAKIQVSESQGVEMKGAPLSIILNNLYAEFFLHHQGVANFYILVSKWGVLAFRNIIDT
jgi:hypothetical protein